MANPEHLNLLKKGVEEWNDWIAKERLRARGGIRHEGARIGTASFWPDLRGADLSGLDLYQGKAGAGWTGIDLIGADLRGALLRNTLIAWANLVGASLYQADLEGATLNSSRLDGSNLSEANLTNANIAGCNFLMANLKNARLAGVHIASTVFSDADLTGATGLESCKHGGPSTLDYRTLVNYGPLPSIFLKGCGLPDDFIRFVSTSRSDANRFFSCFISHSEKDGQFVARLFEDLESAGVRCWLAEKDLKYGAKLLEAFYAAIADNQRLVIVCSEASISSGWVEDEITTAFSLERERGHSIVVPIRIDDTILVATKGWATKLRDSRLIGDFKNWRDQEAYRRSFQKLLEALNRSAE